MTDRKGTGNYDGDRKNLNVEYVPLTERNLYQQVKTNLKNKNIEYRNGKNTNMLNGIVFTSGSDFFEALGMDFIPTDRTYKTGDKKGQYIKTPNIKNKEDIPQAVSYYFDSCMEYLKEMVGEENIILAQVHYDEDTPHLQAYFLPVVDEVKRKVLEKDINNNVIKIETKNKDGKIKLVPKIKRDEHGKIIYESAKGKFLNNDQFWKDKGGRHSYAKMQDSFNEFINERGFNLDRGNIGTNIEHQTKVEYQLNEQRAELEEIKHEKDYITKQLETVKDTLFKAQQEHDKEVLFPTKHITGYNTKQVEKLIDYSKNLEKENIIQKDELVVKDNTIEQLTLENNHFKNNKEILNQKKIIKEQNETIKEQDQEISRLNKVVKLLNNSIDSIKDKLDKEIKTWKNLFTKMCNAIDKVLDREETDYVQDYEDLADSIIHDYYDDHDKEKDDFEMSL